MKKTRRQLRKVFSGRVELPFWSFLFAYAWFGFLVIYQDWVNEQRSIPLMILVMGAFYFGVIKQLRVTNASKTSTTA